MTRVRRMLVSVAAALSAAGFAVDPAHAVIDVDCSGLELKGAEGVPGHAVHKYKFKGSCNVVDAGSIGGAVVAKLWAEASARWDQKTQTLEEAVQVTGSMGKYSGEVQSVLKCEKDPIVYATWCVVLQHKNSTGLDAFSNAAVNQKRPILQGKTSLAAAAGASMNLGIAAGSTAGKDNDKGKASDSKLPPASSAQSAATSTTAASAPGAQRAPLSPAPSWSKAPQVPAVQAPPGAAPAGAAPTSGLASAGAGRAAVERELAAVSCTRTGLDGLRFACATRSGFERCEALRSERKVEQCAPPR